MKEILGNKKFPDNNNYLNCNDSANVVQDLWDFRSIQIPRQKIEELSNVYNNVMFHAEKEENNSEGPGLKIEAVPRLPNISKIMKRTDGISLKPVREIQKMSIRVTDDTSNEPIVCVDCMKHYISWLWDNCYEDWAPYMQIILQFAQEENINWITGEDSWPWFIDATNCSYKSCFKKYAS